MNNAGHSGSSAFTVRVLWAAVVSLLLLNAALVGWLWLARPAAPGVPVTGAAFLPETLAFTAAQRVQYDTLRRRYLLQVRPLTRACRADYQQYFQLLDSTLSDQQLLARSRAALASKAAVDVHTLRHLQHVLALCTPAQAQRLRHVLQRVPALTHPGHLAAEGTPAACPAGTAPELAKK